MTVADKPNRNARPKPASVKGTSDGPTTASTWKKKTVGGTLFTVPSGNTAILRTPGMQAFLQQGVIPNGLMPFVQEAMKKGQVPSKDDMGSLLDDPEKIQSIMELADSVTINCCVDPKVEPVPTEEVIVVGGATTIEIIPIGDPRRDENTLYVDEVDFEDKMFIFNVAVGGTSDLEKFREGLESNVGALSEQ